MTRYSDRLATHELGAAAPLVFSYADALRNAGWEEARSWPYAYDRFANGVAIAPLVRELYRELGDESARFGNPFLAGAGTFYAWLQEPVRPSRRITRLWMAVHGLRADLQDAFPDPLGTN